jgi:hypothetical protein
LVRATTPNLHGTAPPPPTPPPRQSEALKDDIRVISQVHERDVERHDALIQMLDRDLDDADTQREALLRQHRIALDRLLGIQACKLVDIERAFVSAVRSLEDEFAAERAVVASNHRVQHLEVRHLIEVRGQVATAHAETARAEFEQQRESHKRRSLEAIHQIQSEMESAIEGIERSFEGAHVAYLSCTDRRTQDFKVSSVRLPRYGCHFNHNHGREFFIVTRSLQFAIPRKHSYCVPSPLTPPLSGRSSWSKASSTHVLVSGSSAPSLA